MNIGSGQRISLNDVLRLATRWLDVTLPPEYLEPRQGDVRDSLADISRARDILSYTPEVSFEEGLQRTMEAMRPNVTE
jgi:nucleoside-diphosphate-sugar epimerase